MFEARATQLFLQTCQLGLWDNLIQGSVNFLYVFQWGIALESNQLSLGFRPEKHGLLGKEGYTLSSAQHLSSQLV